MRSVFDFLNEFRDLLRGSEIRFAITSGMACVRYGLQQTTKDSDWIVEPEDLGKLIDLFDASEQRMPPWRVRYRAIFGAPLEREWFEGGWTSHLTIFTSPSLAGNNVDWFGRPPRVRAWTADSEGFAARSVVAQMKKTDRLRDWPLVDGLAWQLRESDPLNALLNLESPEAIQRLWDNVSECLRDRARKERPLLRLVRAGGDGSILRPALLRERETWMAINKARYRVYQHEWKEFFRRWRQDADWEWPTEEPLREQHKRLVEAARNHLLPCAPLAHGKSAQVYENGLQEAAKQLDVSLDKIREIAPPPEIALP